jgi:hypothetical protein
MTNLLTYECNIHFRRRGRGSRREMEMGKEPARPTREPGRVPRVARLMALAIRFDGYLRAGQVCDYAELAELGHVTRARISQIMNLLTLAPDIQAALLFLPRTLRGHDPIILRDLQPIASVLDWRKQRVLWQQLTANATGV